MRLTKLNHSSRPCLTHFHLFPAYSLLQDVKDAMDGIERQLIRDEDFAVDLEQQYKSRGQGAYKVYLEPYSGGD